MILEYLQGRTSGDPFRLRDIASSLQELYVVSIPEKTIEGVLSEQVGQLVCDGDGGFSVVEDALFISAGTRAHERRARGPGIPHGRQCSSGKEYLTGAGELSESDL